MQGIKTKSIIFSLILVTLFSATVRADAGFFLLQVENGARSSAMGEAFVSISGDPLSQRYNPAGTHSATPFHAYLGHTVYWENVTFETGYITVNHGDMSYHLGARISQVSDLEARGISPSAQPDNYFEARDMSFKGGVARKINERLTLGLSVGWLIEKIDFYRESSINLDLGGIYRLDNGLTLGAAVNHIGGDIQYNQAKASLPTAFRVGGSYPFRDQVFVALDGVIIDSDFHAHVGAEYVGIQRLALRAGYQSGYDSKSVTFGAGFTERGIRVDYSFVPYSNELGDSHQFGLSIFVD